MTLSLRLLLMLVIVHGEDFLHRYHFVSSTPPHCLCVFFSLFHKKKNDINYKKIKYVSLRITTGSEEKRVAVKDDDYELVEKK